MTLLDRPAPSTAIDAHVTGWLVSLILHGTLAYGMFLFLQQITLPPQQTPFQWDVAMVAPAPQATTAPTRTATQSTPPMPSRTSAVNPAPTTAEPAAQSSELPPPIAHTHRCEPLSSHPVTEQTPQPVTEHASLSNTAETTEHSVSQVEQMTPLAPPAAPLPQREASAPVAQPPVPPSSSLRNVGQANLAPSAPALSTASQPGSSAPVEPALAAQRETETAHTDSTPPQQVAAFSPSSQAKSVKTDYGWLTNLMAKWSNDLDKPYPTMLRTEDIQGKVTVSALLHDDGTLSHVRVAKSSGNSLLDQAAVEAVKNGPPVKLSRPLERHSILVNIPIVYILSDTR